MSTLRTQLSQRLEKISGIEKSVLQGKFQGFTYFSYRGKEVAHFDNNNEFDLKLTKSIIKKEQLSHPTD